MTLETDTKVQYSIEERSHVLVRNLLYDTGPWDDTNRDSDDTGPWDDTNRYVINERLMEMVEHTGILTQTQGGFHQNKNTDINVCKLYGLTKTVTTSFLKLKKKIFLLVQI